MYFCDYMSEEKIIDNLGKRLREIREAKRMTQKEVAEAMGIVPTQYSKVERGVVIPGAKTLISAAKVLGVSLDELVYGKSNNINDYLPFEMESFNNLSEEEKYLVNEFINLVFARKDLKKITDNFKPIPEDVSKKMKR